MMTPQQCGALRLMIHSSLFWDNCVRAWSVRFWAWMWILPLTGCCDFESVRRLHIPANKTERTSLTFALDDQRRERFLAVSTPTVRLLADSALALSLCKAPIPDPCHSTNVIQRSMDLYRGRGFSCPGSAQFIITLSLLSFCAERLGLTPKIRLQLPSDVKRYNPMLPTQRMFVFRNRVPPHCASNAFCNPTSINVDEA